MERNQKGFTLVELLVVVLIIAILAAIAIPVFVRQREKAYVAGIQSTLRNAATAAEAYATPRAGSFAGVDWATLQSEENAKASDSQTVTVTIAADEAAYCVQVVEDMVAAAHPWRTAHFVSRGAASGSPQPGTCPVAF